MSHMISEVHEDLQKQTGGTWHSLHHHEQATSYIHQSWQDQAVSQAMTKLNRFNTKVPRERLFVIHQTCRVQTNQVQGSFCMQVRHHGEMIHTGAVITITSRTSPSTH